MSACRNSYIFACVSFFFFQKKKMFFQLCCFCNLWRISLKRWRRHFSSWSLMRYKENTPPFLLIFSTLCISSKLLRFMQMDWGGKAVCDDSDVCPFKITTFRIFTKQSAERWVTMFKVYLGARAWGRKVLHGSTGASLVLDTGLLYFQGHFICISFLRI